MICFGNSHRTVKEFFLSELTRTPDLFDGKHVRVAGYIKLQHENMSIYPSASDDSCSKRALWLSIETFPGGYDALFQGLRAARKARAGYGFVEGVFTRQCTGHLGLWPAGIEPLTRLAVAESNAEWPDW